MASGNGKAGSFPVEGGTQRDDTLITARRRWERRKEQNSKGSMFGSRECGACNPQEKKKKKNGDVNPSFGGQKKGAACKLDGGEDLWAVQG